MCGRLDLRRDPNLLLEEEADRLGLVGQDRVTPMRPLAVVISPTECRAALWGWPPVNGTQLLTHARSETAATLPTWRKAWRERRGVIGIRGWYEGSWYVAAPGAHIAVLWTMVEDVCRIAVLTQPPPAGVHIERFPLPLTKAGALEWLAGGGLDNQVRDLRVQGVDGQRSIFDE